MSCSYSYEEVEEEEPETKIIYEADIDEITIEPPMDEWSSLDIKIKPEENKKKILYEQGLYSPGSGEICAKYVALSASSVYAHPYYKYRAVLDPGIMHALKEPEKKTSYPNDGQELYMAISEEMNQCPVQTFHRGLVKEVINLRYYSVNPKGVRAMAMALRYNNYVKVLDLTDSFLTEDACFHLGEMLETNNCLTELNLNGCRIGPEGVRKLCNNLPTNRQLKVLRLNSNELGDNGVEYIAKVIFKKIEIDELYLSYNNIGNKGCLALHEVFETYNNFTVLDLSWNSLFPCEETNNLLIRLGENEKLRELYLSWNNLAGSQAGIALRKVMAAPKLQHLDLSNNRIATDAIKKIVFGLRKAHNLITLDLSYNPLLSADASRVLTKMCNPSVKVQRVLMEDVTVDDTFLNLLSQVMSMESRSNVNTIITYGDVITKLVPKSSDIREIIFNRIDFLSRKQNNKVHFALLVKQLLKDGFTEMVSTRFIRAVRSTGVHYDDDLLNGLISLFRGPSPPKKIIIDLVKLNDYVDRKWPDMKLPPTPPPQPEPKPKPKNVKKKKISKK